VSGLPHLEVWRSVRQGGDTKTKKSRRTLALPAGCLQALRKQLAQQLADRLAASDRRDSGLVFTTAVGSSMDAPTFGATSVVRSVWSRYRAGEWTPRELRHSFVSVLSDAGIPVEPIAQFVGHSGTTVTELVYRHQLRPVIQTGAAVMDRLFAPDSRPTKSGSRANRFRSARPICC
jgi:integrase